MANLVRAGLSLCGLVLLTLACTLSPGADPGAAALATRVAATLTAMAPLEAASNTPAASATDSLLPTQKPAPSASPSPTPTPPPDGLSLNCDGSYQRVRLENPGESGQALIVDRWTGSAWQLDWQFDGGEPAIRQITQDAGAYRFGGCRHLLIVPLLYQGSGSILELKILQWDENGVNELYAMDGSHGSWSLDGSLVRFERALYLQGEPNCCPCNRERIEHNWDGVSFIEVESEITPTYTGTPPPICQ